MEKLSQSIHKELGPVILYLDDIKEIVRILKEEGDLSDITIETMTYKYNDNEIENINSPISKIYSRQPYISIEFGEKVSLESYSDGILIRGVIQKLEELFSRNQRNIFYRYPIINRLLIQFIVITVSNWIAYYMKLPLAIGFATVLVIILSTFLIGIIITLPEKGKRPQKNRVLGTLAKNLM